ncbi:MAG: endonuclease domain-containing protein [Tepidiformaceae bacterium]
MDQQQKFHRDNVPAARRLRRPMTGTEALLWEHLRDRKFHGLKFRRQHPIAPYVADFFCSELQLILEIDGAVHSDPEQQIHDRERTLFLQGLGCEVVRILNSQVESNPEQALAQALPNAQISLPPPQWEKGRG